MKRVKILVLAAMLAVVGAGCQQSEIDEIKRDIDQIDRRLQALETQVKALNDNVAALSTLLNGATINSVSESDGTYTITLSNGEVITLTQGSEGGYLTPIVSVDSEGYWQVSLDGGTQFERITGPDGQPVRAVAEPGDPGDAGTDGVTPKFKVDSDGYWTVSYDEGANYERVTDPDGQPVKATEGRQQDKFFADVTVEEDAFVLELLNGQTYRIPIASGFLCKIDNSEEVVYFAQGETRTFDVELQGVVATIVSAPEGWSAELKALAQAPESGANHTLTVTSPAATRATADSRIDLAILAVSQTGLSTIAKMAVATNDLVLHTPRVVSVTVDGSQTTENSLTFSVVTDDAKSWKYLCKPSSEDAPDAQTVFETGTEGAEGSVKVDGLTQGTAYTIYVVAYYDSAVSTEVGKAEARTARGNVDYYEDGVEIGGTRYDKNSSNVKLITSTTAISTPGVYFLDPQGDAKITIDKMTATDVVIIGRHSLQRVKVTMTSGPISLGNGNGLILKNVEFDAGEYTAYLFNFASGSITTENFILDDSKIIMRGQGTHMSYFNNGTGVLNNVELNNSTIKILTASDGQAARLINFNSGVLGKSFTMENTVVYSENFVTNGTVVHVNGAGQAMPDVTLKVKNNSFINFIGQPNAYLYLSTVKSIEFSKNILYAKPDYGVVSYTLGFYQDPNAELDYEDNICYGLASNNAGSFKYFKANSPYVPKDGNYTKTSSNPFSEMNFATETFTPQDADYGASF
ncbi:MAG: DUF4957 domain-containing protein [Alistipes sp.]|nr:DUF4957 domain-containing protein [Alistipes sp.]